MFVKRGEDIGLIDVTRPPAGPLEPGGHGRTRGDARRLCPEQLRNRYAGLGCAPHQARIYIVVDISDLDRLWHQPQLIMTICMSTCAFAC